MQGTGYTGDGIADKPSWRKCNNPEISKSRKPLPMLEEQKKEAVLSEVREWCHPKEAGITAASAAGAGVT